MQNQLGHNVSDPYTDCTASDDDDDCVPLNSKNINELYIYRDHCIDHCINRFLIVQNWYQLSNKSQCDCHQDSQLVPLLNDNNVESLPIVLNNHITDYWKSIPLTNDRYFSGDPEDFLADFNVQVTENQSNHDDDERNIEGDNNLYINRDPISSYSPVHLSPISSLIENIIPERNYDHSVLVDSDDNDPVELLIVSVESVNSL